MSWRGREELWFYPMGSGKGVEGFKLEGYVTFFVNE